METIAHKRKAPTKAEAMKVLIEMERKLIRKENEEAQAAKKLAQEEVRKLTAQYALANWGTLKEHLHIEVSDYTLEVGIKFRIDPKDNDATTTKMPPELCGPFKKFENIDANPNGWRDPDKYTPAELRSRINDKLKRVSADAVINGTNCAQVERTPVVKEYLEEFLASLTKASKAAERLAA